MYELVGEEVVFQLQQFFLFRDHLEMHFRFAFHSTHVTYYSRLEQQSIDVTL